MQAVSWSSRERDHVVRTRSANRNAVAPRRSSRVGTDSKGRDARLSATSSRAADFLSGAVGGICHKIARDWNMPASGAGFVTRFEVLRSFLERYSVREGSLEFGGRHGRTDTVRIVRGHRHAGVLRAGGSQPSVGAGVRGILWAGFDLRFPAGRLAIWPRGGDLGRRGAAALDAQVS